ncbi:MAG: TIGR01212 family radical SAM protein [Lachnospiraceae bacterium]|nr:TIGR01212 family radical SAM protein [Lachnospiraceae bacterium]
MNSHGKRYYSLNDYCLDTFGEKVYRLSLSGGMTCPNRDGTYGTGGCAFCSAGGSGDFAADSALSITEQMLQAKARIAAKTDCHKFIAYFQSYTGTYAPVPYLRKIFSEAIAAEDVVALSIATRSDCLSDEVLDLLSDLNRIKPVWVELGLQTIHNQTLAQMHTHSTVEQFDSAVSLLSARGLPVITHVILGLPGETQEMMLQTIRHVAAMPVFGIKLQLLHVLRKTALADLYETNPFPVMDMPEYCDLVIRCLSLLPPGMVIHRLTGDGPRRLLIAPLWSTDKKRVLNTIHHRLKELDCWQGKYYNQKEI